MKYPYTKMRYQYTKSIAFNPMECFTSSRLSSRHVSDVKVNMIRQFIRDHADELFGENAGFGWTITSNGYAQIKTVEFNGEDVTDKVKRLLRGKEDVSN